MLPRLNDRRARARRNNYLVLLTTKVFVIIAASHAAAFQPYLEGGNWCVPHACLSHTRSIVLSDHFWYLHSRLLEYEIISFYIDFIFRMKLRGYRGVYCSRKIQVFGVNVLAQVSAGKTDIEDMKECRCKLESTLQALHT